MFTLSIGLTGHSISDKPSIFWWKRRVLIELVYFQRRGAAMQVRQAYIVCAHDITSTCGIPPQLPLLLLRPFLPLRRSRTQQLSVRTEERTDGVSPDIRERRLCRDHTWTVFFTMAMKKKKLNQAAEYVIP